MIFSVRVVYKLLAPDLHENEINEMQGLMEQHYPSLVIDQDLGLGMMLWLCHFFLDEPWAAYQLKQNLALLNTLWVDPPGYFCRQTSWHDMKFAFTNYGVSLGLQSVDQWSDRVDKLNLYFDDYRSGDEYDTNAITHVMACTSHFPGLFIQTRDSKFGTRWS